MKNKTVFVYLGMILLSSALMISCSDDEIVTPVSVPVDSSDFRYPFTDGSTWNYTITASVSDVRPDSMKSYFNNVYPLVLNGTVTILYDTLINSVLTKCFTDEFSNNGQTIINRYYYINNDTALILFAQRQPHPASGYLPLRKIKNGIVSSDLDKLNLVNNAELQVLTDSLTSTLKYPMKTGTTWSWTFENSTTFKKYLGFENVIVPAGTISCMKTELILPYLPEVRFYSYYSKSGLIKTHVFYNDINLVTPGGEATVDLTGETVVNSFHISAN